MKPTDLARRADALLTQAAADGPVDDTFELPLLRGERFLGRLLARVVVTCALLTVLGAAACALLAWFGLWQPVVAGPVLLVLTAVAVRVSAAVSTRPMPVWSAAALVVVALAAMLWAGATSSQEVLPRRDPGSYLQTSVELARHHRIPITVPVNTIGGPDALRIRGVTLASPAFYQTGSAARPTVQPQFLIGPPAWYSVGYWLGGLDGALLLPGIFGGLGVLAIGLLVASVVGPRWAPLGAVGAAICFPLLHLSRATYSEPLSIPVLAAGLFLLAEATRAGARTQLSRARTLGFLAGLLVGGGGLIRIDALRETVLLLPIAALLVVRRYGAGAPLLWGAGIATAVSAVPALGLSYRYLGDIAASLVPLVLLGIGLCVIAGLVVRAARRGTSLTDVVPARFRDSAPVWLPRAAALLVAVVGVALATRPLWQTVRQSAADPGSRVVAGLQLRQGLTVDGGRTYAEQSLAWTAWWVGPVAVGIAFVVFALAGHRLVRGWLRGERLPMWSGPYLVALASCLLTWYRPGITPDHPWADRRLFIVLPTVVVCVVVAAAWLTRWSTRRLSPVALVAASAGTAALLLVPEALATWPHAGEQVESGEVAAVQQVCRSFSPGDVALMVDSRAANEWPQVLRGTCDVPALSLDGATRKDPARSAAAVQALARDVTAQGRRLVLLSADSRAAVQAIAGAGVRLAPTQEAVDVLVREDARLLVRRPDHTVALPIQVWLSPVLT